MGLFDFFKKNKYTTPPKDGPFTDWYENGQMRMERRWFWEGILDLYTKKTLKKD